VVVYEVRRAVRERLPLHVLDRLVEALPNERLLSLLDEHVAELPYNHLGGTLPLRKPGIRRLLAVSATSSSYAERTALFGHVTGQPDSELSRYFTLFL